MKDFERRMTNTLLLIMISQMLIILSLMLVRSTKGEETQYRDRYGRLIGSSTTTRSQTTYRDRLGRSVITGTSNGRTTTYRDRSGRTILQQSGGVVPVPFTQGYRYGRR